jgi:hypothetical protein
MGGLGNQLFQIFAALAYSLNTGEPIIFPYSDQAFGKFTQRKVYWGSFLSSIQVLAKKMIPKFDMLREKSFEYTPLTKIFGKNIILFGYYQSYKYFESKYDAICNMIRLQEKKSQVLEKYKHFNYDFNDSVSMHFRIGDYIDIQDKYPILEKSYYSNALSTILNKNFDIKRLFFFTEFKDIIEVNTIIIELKKEFPNLGFIYVSQIEEDWEEMLLMSLCSHNIIANSTFSWWGAYFNDNAYKIVCYPDVWFGPSLQHSTKDLFPPSWTQINSH